MAARHNEILKQRAPKYTELNDLASEKVGGKVLFATDDWFAVAENLLTANPPIWKAGVFTEYGKWFDGWETRRKRIPGHDWCIIQLGAPGIIHGVDVDTSFFTGNYAPRVSIQAATLARSYPARKSAMGTAASEDQMEKIKALGSDKWTEILPMTVMQPGYQDSCQNFHEITNRQRWTHIRLNIYPDGGVARLRVYGEVIPDWVNIHPDKLIDLVAMLNGGICTGYSDAHYGHPRNLIGPGRSVVMEDGWETARKLSRPAILKADQAGILQVTGSDWAEFKLGHVGIISKIEIDTNHFKGNFPDSCHVEAIEADPNNPKTDKASGNHWKILLPTQKLKAHQRHFYEGNDIKKLGPVSKVRLVMAPDGGISRIRVWGFLTKKETAAKL